jgi:hypothetical protein
MIGHVIDVEYEDGTVNIAKIVSDENTEYMVKPSSTCTTTYTSLVGFLTAFPKRLSRDFTTRRTSKTQDSLLKSTIRIMNR